MSGVSSGGRRGQVDRLVGGERGRRQQVGAGRLCGLGQHHDVLEGRQLVPDHAEPLGEPHVLDDRHLGPAVAGQVRHLLGRRRVVDRDGRGPAQHDRQVDDVELGDVPHHEHDPVAGADPEGTQPGGGPGHPVGHLPEGDLHPGVAVPGPQRHPVGNGGDRVEPATGDGLPLDLGVDGRGVDLVRDRLHG